MIDPKDRVLHYALKLVHREQPQVDQTAEILAAWERGVRGSGIPEAEPDEELLEERELVRAAARTPILPPWLIAASVLAAGGLAVWTFGPGGQEPGGNVGQEPGGNEVAGVPAVVPDVPAEVEGPVTVALVTDEDRALFANAFEVATEKLYDWAVGRPVIAMPGGELGPADELVRLLRENPALWSDLEQRTLALVDESPEPPAVVGRILDLVVSNPSDEAFEVARGLWMRAPAAFSEDHVVALAERGAFEFEREVASRVALYTPDTPEQPVLSATYLAFRGDEDALTFLVEHLQGESKTVAPRDLAAAVVLDYHGHPERWFAVKGRVKLEVESALERGDLDLARRIALGFEFFHRARAEGEMMQLGGLPMRTAKHSFERMDELPEPEDIRALIQSM